MAICRCSPGLCVSAVLGDDDGELFPAGSVADEQVQRLADRHAVAREHQHGDGGPAPAPSISILDISIVHLLSTITDIVGFVIIIITATLERCGRS